MEMSEFSIVIAQLEQAFYNIFRFFDDFEQLYRQNSVWEVSLLGMESDFKNSDQGFRSTTETFKIHSF